MPPRIPLSCPGRAASSFTLSIRQFSSTTAPATWYADTYVRAQKKAHDAATRRKKLAVVVAARKPGDDPVRGLTTAFVKQFDEPPPPKIDILTGKVIEEPGQSARTAQQTAEEAQRLNFRLTREMVDEQFEVSKYLSQPTVERREPVDELDEVDEAMKTKNTQEYEAKKAAALEAHEAAHRHATEAMERILKLNVGNSKDRMRVNFDKCVETFGRHNTDAELLSKRGDKQAVKDRAGPDVGSSEVQIAIATVKIRNLANFIQQRGRKDHHNKRNLRLLVHKRQKMLKYLRRRERGGPRWQHVINTLGLTEATWKGEIVV